MFYVHVEGTKMVGDGSDYHNEPKRRQMRVVWVLVHVFYFYFVISFY